MEFQQKNIIDMRNGFLYKCPYFQNLEELDKNALLRCLSAHLVNFAKNEIIVFNDSPATNIYIIVSGHARSYYPDLNGKKLIAQDYPKNSIFGLDYLNNTNRNFKEYLIALEDTSVLVCNSFRSITTCQNRCKRHVDFIKALINEMSLEYFNSKERINIISQGKTSEKLLAFLRYYQNKKKNKYFTIPFNRSEIAEFISCERSAMSTELNKLKKEGVIDFDGNSYLIKKK